VTPSIHSRHDHTWAPRHSRRPWSEAGLGLGDHGARRGTGPPPLGVVHQRRRNEHVHRLAGVVSVGLQRVLADDGAVVAASRGSRRSSWGARHLLWSAPRHRPSPTGCDRVNPATPRCVRLRPTTASATCGGTRRHVVGVDDDERPVDRRRSEDGAGPCPSSCAAGVGLVLAHEVQVEVVAVEFRTCFRDVAELQHETRRSTPRLRASVMACRRRTSTVRAHVESCLLPPKRLPMPAAMIAVRVPSYQRSPRRNASRPCHPRR
jgi:hypothetical protein